MRPKTVPIGFLFLQVKDNKRKTEPRCKLLPQLGFALNLIVHSKNIHLPMVVSYCALCLSVDVQGRLLTGATIGLIIAGGAYVSTVDEATFWYFFGSSFYQ